MRLRKSKALVFVTLGLLLSSGLLFAYSPPAASGASKIQHLIFIVQENHSFDNYFGTYPGANGLSNASVCCQTSLSGSSDLVASYHLNVNQPIMIVGDELPPGQMYPNASDSIESDGNGPFLLTNETVANLDHSWRTAFTDWNYGKMNGFIVGENSSETMGYYDRSGIPYYWDYANNFVLDDDFFSSMMGGSFPNHLYIASGSAGNGTLPNTNGDTWIVNGTVIDNPSVNGSDRQILVDLNLTWMAMAQELSQHGVTWKWYDGAADPTASTLWDVLPLFSYFQQNPQLMKQNVVGTQSFVDSINSDSLPSVSWIIPGSSWSPPTAPFTYSPPFAYCATDEHPPARSDCGMDYVSYLVNTVMNSSYWNSTAIVITWDDYGGFYDHVPPPQTTGDGEGFRVPTLIISPYAKHGYIDHTPYEFGSMLSLVEHSFGLPSLGARDSTGIGKNDMMNAFDFNQRPQPPLIEPGTFLGPKYMAPLSNGYPTYVPTTTTTATTTVTTTLTITSTASTSSLLTTALLVAGAVVVVIAVAAGGLVLRTRRTGMMRKAPGPA